MTGYIYTLIASTLIAVIGWAFGIEPRLKVLDQKHVDLKELLNVQLVSIDKRLERIENSLNGALHKG